MTPAPKLSEADFQRQVVELARLYGWRTYHTFDSRRSDEGWPDLVLARPPTLLVVELKAEAGRVSPAQARWLATLADCGIDARVWFPSDWPDIERTLARLPRTLAARLSAVADRLVQIRDGSHPDPAALATDALRILGQARESDGEAT